jgi:hypothetical protein
VIYPGVAESFRAKATSQTRTSCSSEQSIAKMWQCCSMPTSNYPSSGEFAGGGRSTGLQRPGALRRLNRNAWGALFGYVSEKDLPGLTAGRRFSCTFLVRRV